MDVQYILATDLDRAWLNFELDLPLQPGPNGETNPFYVDRPGNPTARLERELLREYSQTPKYFFSGSRLQPRNFLRPLRGNAATECANCVYSLERAFL